MARRDRREKLTTVFHLCLVHKYKLSFNLCQEQSFNLASDQCENNFSSDLNDLGRRYLTTSCF